MLLPWGSLPMRSAKYWLPLCLPLLWGCQKSQAPQAGVTPNVHYVRENMWLGDGKYFYPQEMTSLDQTGLASVIGDDHPPLTTDGELYDPTALIAQHQTLQLPAIVQVTNLENGRVIKLRVNDRGPTDPGRVIALSSRAAQLLQIDPGAPAQVRITLDADQTQALAAQLHGGDLQLAMQTAPVGVVAEESLAPPPGVHGGGGHAAVVSDAGAARSCRKRDARRGRTFRGGRRPLFVGGHGGCGVAAGFDARAARCAYYG